jgi:CheY-like chemotaxis protein
MDMVSLLEQRGFVVLQAADADEAIAVLTRNPEVDGVLSDIDMPGSMDGIALVEVISKRWPPCRLILVSGMKAPRPEHLPDRTHFIPKPVSSAVLDRTLVALDLAPSANRTRLSF